MEKIDQAVKALAEMGARRVILFGSAVDHPESANDVDLAVDGIAPRHILDADVKVGEILRQPYDLVCREEDADFFEIVSRYGRVLYG